jgi:DNA-binding transcriptional MerR regulator
MRRTDRELLKIGEFAHLTGVPAKTLRFYDELGLVVPSVRTAAGYRLYGPQEAAARLAFVKRAKLLGLSLQEIKELTDLIDKGSTGKVISRLEEVLEARLAESEQRMAELKEFRETFLRNQRQLFEADPFKTTS